MAHEPRRIHFDDFVRRLQSIFDMLAHQKEPILVEREGRLFRVEAEQLHDPQDIWAGYNPERVREVLQRSVGALKGIDLEELKRDIREERAQDSHGLGA